MRRQYSTLIVVAAMVISFSCSTPKYTYNFDYYDYNSGRRGSPDASSKVSLVDPLKVDKTELLAAAEPTIGMSVEPASPTHAKAISEDISPVNDLSRAEKKQLRKELKNYIKSRTKESKIDEVASVNATKQLDDDLKLAIIFGAIGITFAILGGINTVFWVIGVIGLIVGLVFFIRWISTQ
jgi:hypothetical protein